MRVLLRPTSDRRRLALTTWSPRSATSTTRPRSSGGARLRGRLPRRGTSGILERRCRRARTRARQRDPAGGPGVPGGGSAPRLHQLGGSLGCPRPEGTIGDESTPFDWDHRRFPYQAAKRAAEEAVPPKCARGSTASSCSPPRPSGRSTGTCRRRASSTTCTPADHRLPARRAHRRRCGSHRRGAVPRAAARGPRGERYVLGSDHLTYRTMFTQIARRAGRRPPASPCHVPDAGRLVRRGPRRVLAPAARPRSTRASAALGCLRLCYRSAKAVSTGSSFGHGQPRRRSPSRAHGTAGGSRTRAAVVKELSDGLDEASSASNGTGRSCSSTW